MFWPKYINSPVRCLWPHAAHTTKTAHTFFLSIAQAPNSPHRGVDATSSLTLPLNSATALSLRFLPWISQYNSSTWNWCRHMRSLRWFFPFKSLVRLNHLATLPPLLHPTLQPWLSARLIRRLEMYASVPYVMIFCQGSRSLLIAVSWPPAAVEATNAAIEVHLRKKLFFRAYFCPLTEFRFYFCLVLISNDLLRKKLTAYLQQLLFCWTCWLLMLTE